jgi:lipopolysaccharide biosynthesis regulator YciM
VISMATLLKYLTDLVEDSHKMGHSHHGDLLKLAGLIHERGDLEKAGRMLEALTSSDHTDVALSARQSLSLIYKKTRRWQEAADIWQSLVESDPHNFLAVQELAKYCEHHGRDCGRALQLVSGLLDEAVHLSHVERRSLEHRYQRLLRKLPSR